MTEPMLTKGARRRFNWFLTFVGLLLIIGVIFHTLGLGSFERIDAQAWLLGISVHKFAYPLVLGTVFLASVLAIPLGMIVVVCGFIMPIWQAALTAYLGLVLGAVVSFCLGRYLGYAFLESVGGKLDRVSRGMAKRGVLSVVVIRLLPIAPFAVVNMVAGALRFRFSDFVVGTALGLIPGVAGLTLVSKGILAFVLS